MKLTILTIGSRGDVQPKIALALRLQEAGYQVRLATHALFRDFVTGYGIPFAPIAGDPRLLLQSRDGHSMLAGGRSAVTFLRNLRRMALPILPQVFDDCLSACRDADAVLHSLLAFPGHDVAEFLGVPSIPLLLQPVARTHAFPTITVPSRLRLGGSFNWATHVAVENLFWQVIRPHLNAWRVSVLGLPRLRQRGWVVRQYHEHSPLLFGFSHLVVARPADWHENMIVSGYWTLAEPSWTPPPALLAFLEAGPPPVCIGFGSMANRDPAQITTLALEALALAGQRGILLSGWGGLSNADLPAYAFKLEAAPHGWLFPRMKAVVHHGGAGTTAAGLRAGVPAQVVPFFGDQPYWGERIAALGVGPLPLPRRTLTAQRLADHLRLMDGDQAMQARAAELGQALRAEDGTGVAVAALSRWLGYAGG